MTYSLTIWNKPGSDETRIYVNGTTRSAVYLHRGTDGTTKWSSKVNDTPAKFRSGDHWGKVRKDAEAAADVAEAFEITLSETTFDDALAIARSGVGPRADD